MNFPRSKVRGNFIPHEEEKKAVQLPELNGLFDFF